MPKAHPVNASRPALRRNQACRSCRKRKLKCDAARPHCSTCVKQWQAIVSVPAPVGYAHPTEPQCSYDPVEGLTLAPDTDPAEKIRELEEEISTLKAKLFEQQTSNSGHASSATARASSSGQSTDGGIALPQASIALMNLIASDSPDSRFRSTTSSPDLQNPNPNKTSDPFMDLLFSGWNPDLPDPTMLGHYIDAFFRNDPCGSRILHKPSFLQSIRAGPRDPGFPHAAILHAICASASRWYPQTLATLPDGSRRDQFAEFHASKTRQYIDKTMGSGEDIFSVMQACILLSWYFYQEGRWVEVWIFAGFQTRVAVPLRLNYPGTFSTHGNNSPGAYLAPPKDPRDLESRRRTWWMTVLFDRIASVGGWIHAVDERDLGTELPLRTQDFEAESPVPNNPQSLADPNFFTIHQPRYTDSFILLIKAVMLFGRVTDFNVRGNLRAPTAPSNTQDPFSILGFDHLDSLVYAGFLNSLPPVYRGFTTVGGAPDTDLYMVHVIPHAATITLHNPYINFDDPLNKSTERCTNAADAILSAYYTLTSTSFDITRLHPFVTICWYLAAVVQVQVCKHWIEKGDEERESTAWGHINTLRFAMIEYGRRSPIGARQEKLLQGLMREIVRMTAQRQPLHVGFPLYPFSHATLFGRDDGGQNQDDGPAPLPSHSSFEQDQRSHQDPISPNGNGASGSVWAGGDVSGSPGMV